LWKFAPLRAAGRHKPRALTAKVIRCSYGQRPQLFSKAGITAQALNKAYEIRLKSLQF